MSREKVEEISANVLEHRIWTRTLILDIIKARGDFGRCPTAQTEAARIENEIEGIRAQLMRTER